MTSVAPGSIARLGNTYYKTDEEFMFACADAMREEYKAIVDAGFILQIDDAYLATTYEVMVPRTMDLQIDNTNGAIEASDVRGSHKIETTNGRRLIEPSGFCLNCPATRPSMLAGPINSATILWIPTYSAFISSLAALASAIS